MIIKDHINRISNLIFNSICNNPEKSLYKAIHTIPFFYYFIFFHAITHVLFAWKDNPPFAAQAFDPIIVLSWAKLLNYESVVFIIQFGFFLTALIGAIFYKKTIARFISAIGLIQFHAFLSSFGPVEHGWIVWMWIGMVFIFFPNIWHENKPTKTDLKNFLLIFWAAQFILLSIYSLAGIGKFFGLISQLIYSQTSMLSIDSAALHITDWATKTGYSGLMSNFIIDNTFIGWLGFIGIFYFQITSIFAAFKPSLHKLWGVALIMSHIAIFLAMGIAFIETLFLHLILLISSPFSKETINIKKTICDMPILGRILKIPIKN